MIDADAIAIHLNFLQEAIQPEGDHDAGGCLAALRALCEEFQYPVIIKETGSGISAKTAQVLWEPVYRRSISVDGAARHWAAIEGVRAEESPHNNHTDAPLGDEFTDWGFPTVVSLWRLQDGGPVIATGGIRSGLDMAKGIALGAESAVWRCRSSPAMRGEQDFNRIETVLR